MTNENEEAIEVLTANVMVACDKANFDRGTKALVEWALRRAIKALEQTDKIEDSNFSTEQYKADLQGSYDCGYNCGYADAMNDIAESEDKE